MDAPQLKIEYLPISALKPYKRNARKHSAADVEAIAESIRAYGFNDPIGIYGENEVVEGHGRLAAAKKLGLTEVPVVRLDHMTDEERRAYAIQHNRTAELSEWDFGKLKLELPELPALNLRGWDVGLGAKKQQEHHEKGKERARWRYANILNLEKAQFPGDGKYDIPALEPVTELPPIRSWMNFSYVTSGKDPEGKAVQFFAHDYQFEFIWNDPDKYVDLLRRYVCVATPDFSPYGDMPFAAQLWNHYRKHWVGAYLQRAGVTVIPTIRASTDPRSFGWFLDGEPHGGIVLISAMWTKNHEERFHEKYKAMVETLNPCKVFVYGKYDVAELCKMGCEDVEIIRPSVFSGREQYKDRVKRNGQR